jgi:hypothetical protein
VGRSKGSHLSFHGIETVSLLAHCLWAARQNLS